MLKFSISFLILITCFYCFTEKQDKAIGLELTKQEIQIEGAYEFISQITELTKPKQQVINISSPDWKGIWIFHHGYFSQSLMRSGRGFLEFPRTLSEVGYRSFSGEYSFKDNLLQLDSLISLHPLQQQIMFRYKYKLDGEYLVLSERLTPHVEDLSDGYSTITLRKLK